MDAKCEVCGKILKEEDLKQFKCLKCEFPLSDKNREIILKNLGLAKENKPPETPVVKPVPLVTVSPCEICGYPLTQNYLDSSVKCPGCESPLKSSPTAKKTADSTPAPVKVAPEPKELGVPRELIQPPAIGTVTLECVIGTAKGKIFDLDQSLSLGRVQFKNAIGDKFAGMDSISRNHLMFSFEKNELFVTDLGSTNGTKVNNDKLATSIPHKIQPGERIIIGEGLGVFRLIKYSQAPDAGFKPVYRLRDVSTGITFPLSGVEIFGRDPNNEKLSHPWLLDIHWHRLLMGEDQKIVSEDFNSISRTQFSLELEIGDGKSFQWRLINLSDKGTQVEDKKLIQKNESILIEKLPATIKCGKNLKAVLEQI